MSRKYKFREPEGLYFVSFSVVDWIDVFTRVLYKDIVVDSLRYCQDHKGLIIYAYVIMSNHVHLLIGKKENTNTLSGIMRDLKKFTAMQIIKAIRDNDRESRREWMLERFQKAGKQNTNNIQYQFWQQDNHPIELSEAGNPYQVLDYIHLNPVVAGWVSEAEDYYYSSARNYGNWESKLKIVSVTDGIEI